MGIFRRIFSKKQGTPTNCLDVVAAKNTGSLGQAEYISNLVTAALERENYPEMNKQLAMITQQDDEREIYVFEHPGVISKYFAIAVCTLLSIIFLYCLFIGVSTVYFSSEFFLLGIFFVLVACIGLFANVALIAKFITAIKYKRRFDVYEELIGYKHLEFIEDLSICSNIQEIEIIKDLKKAIKYKLIPQGHFSNGNLVFMVSDQTYAKYIEKSAVYDRYFQKLINERRRVKSRTKAISQTIEASEQSIERIRAYGAVVKDKNVSRKISRIEAVASMILRELDADPGQASSLSIFLNYYLPTTEKILDTYVTLDEKHASEKSATKLKKELERAIGTSVVAFEGILEKIYDEYEMSISSDIAAMELSMRQEGLLI